MTMLWLLLGIICTIVLFAIFIFLAFVMLYTIWTILSLLEALITYLTSKISKNAGCYHRPEFYLGKLPSDIVCFINDMCNHLHNWIMGIHSYILRQVRR